MKKFEFSLERVLNYKNQMQDSLQNDYSQSVKQVKEKEKQLEELEEQYRQAAERMERLKEEPQLTSSLCAWETYMENLSGRIGMERRHLLLLRREAEQRRIRLTEAKKETASLEILRDKKQAEYKKITEKEQEIEIEEFVASVSSGAMRAG